jgi:hypothetical protein
MQIESSTASLELLTCDLTNKDEAININKVTIQCQKGDVHSVTGNCGSQQSQGVFQQGGMGEHQ